MFDLIIIGGGPAGITAAVYAARKGMKLLVITRDIGGQTAWGGNIENYTGYQFISGPDLTARFEEHMKKYALTLKEDEEVSGLEKKNDVISVKTAKGTYEAASAIVASGKKSRELGVPGEKEFKNRGLTYCATCDGPLFAGKDVAVIGGGNSALDAALQLINIARRIYLVNIAPDLTGDAIMKKKVANSDKVSIFNNAEVTAVTGSKMVEGVKVKQGRSGKEKTLPVGGVFVEVGLIPNSGFAGILDKNKHGEIKVNAYNETNIDGIFAAGDVTDVPEKQIIVAAGEGAKAALRAFRYLAQHK